MMNKVFATKVGSDHLNLRIQHSDRSIHKTLTGDKFDIDGIYARVQRLRALDSGTEEAKDLLDEIEDLISPFKRFVREGIIEEDNAGNFYIQGLNTPIPDAIAEQILKAQKNDWGYEYIVNFWKKCLLNPNEQARKDFFQYCQEYGINITDNGYAILYKAVNRNPEYEDHDIEFVETVAGKYMTVKNKWKKNPSNYHVYRVIEPFTLDNGDYVDTKYYVSSVDINKLQVEWLGTLETAFQEISNPDTGQFRPQHSGDHGMSINLGEAVTMPRDKCDPNISRACSYGLHVGSYDYVKSFGRGLDTILAVFVNPKDIVALPQYDNSKLRTCQYFPYAVMERDEDGHWEELDTGYTESDFMDKEAEQLESQLADLEGDSDLEEDQRSVIKSTLVEVQ